MGFGSSDEVVSAKSRFRKGDILFGKLRPYFRKVIIAPFDGVCSTDIWVIRAKPGVDQKFLFYWMASSEFVEAATRASEGTKMPRAKWEFVERIEKLLPEEDEQRAIAEVLGSLDDKIALNRRMNQTLEALAQAIFKSWFIDFDPVRAKMEGRAPAGMDAEMAALFPDAMDGDVPRGWGKGSLAEEFNLTMGQSPPEVHITNIKKDCRSFKVEQILGLDSQ
jgi:type I restriction enzyme S subunit